MRPSILPALPPGLSAAAPPLLRALADDAVHTRAAFTPEDCTATALHPRRWNPRHLTALLLLWLAIFVAALGTPPLLDDADATHAQAAQAMLRTGDWVTLHVNGVRYLEKPPLPYWIAALSLRLFGENSFAIHLPLALTVLGLALLGYAWGRRAFGQRTALYTGLFTLTAAGVFLFTRIFIPDALLSLLLGLPLYASLRALQLKKEHSRLYAWTMWSALACAVLTKGLVAIVFLAGTLLLYLLLTREWRLARRLHPLSGSALFLAIAAPWHILAALRNPPVPLPAGLGFPARAGWTWFYLYNEHVARFLGHRIPHDYNKLPGYLYWSLHIVWLFPWSLFAPAAIVLAWRERHRLRSALQNTATLTFAQRSVLLLSIFSALILVFFSISTNQEYYTFPVYLPLLLLLAAALAHIEAHTEARIEARAESDIAQLHPCPPLPRTLTFAHAAFTVLGLAIAAALAYGLWTSRHLPFVPDIGDLLAHRDVGGYTLSMSHFFDLTGPSFAALRLPAAIAAIAFALGPIAAWILRRRGRALGSTVAIALTSAAFLIAAHIALVRFSPMLSSHNFAETIQQLEQNSSIAPNTQVMIFGDQAFGSSIPFYLGRRVSLVDGRSTSMLFGSLFPDAPPIFLTSADLLAQWGRGPRKLLFVPLEQRDTVDHLLGPRQITLQETSGKALITDRPLSAPKPAASSTPPR
jgi:4-amino-4-deoxy-L-arabinose transferase-like glycosyltransferase